MSDDRRRRGDRGSGRRGDDTDATDEVVDDFGELTFADDDTSAVGMRRVSDPTPSARTPRVDDDDFSSEIRFADDDAAPIRFGPSDTGPLPHWTEPPTGDLPRIFDDDSSSGSRRGARRVARDSAGEDSDVDIWGSYSGAAPRPPMDGPPARPRRRDDSGFDDDGFGELNFEEDDSLDFSGPVSRSETDPSASRPRIKLGEPAPGSRAERGAGPLRRSGLPPGSDASTTQMRAERGDSGRIGIDDASFGSTDRPARSRDQSGGVSRDSMGRPRPGRPVIGDDAFTAPPPRSGGGSRAGAARGGVPSTRGPRDGRRSGPVAPPGGLGARDMPTAIGVGLVIAAAFIGALMWKPVAVLAFVVLVCGLASIEFYDQVSEKGYRPASVVGIVMAVAAPLAVYWVGETALPLVIVFAFVAAGATFVGATGLNANPLPNMAITTLGMTWIGLSGAYGALIVSMSNIPFQPHIGTDTLLMVGVGVVANDVGALFVGSAAGSTPLRAWISPNKTTEGLMGGTVATFLAMWIVGLQSDTWNDITEIVVLALAVAVLAPLGDLFESMMKRNLGVKDFGSLIKGHGGVLDRFDGFLFVLPAAYYLLIALQPFNS